VFCSDCHSACVYVNEHVFSYVSTEISYYAPNQILESHIFSIHIPSSQHGFGSTP
jgi:hypothetical protein